MELWRRRRRRLAAVMGVALCAAPLQAEARLEGEWLGSFASVQLCGAPATVRDFHLTIRSAPLLHLPAAQFRYDKANVSGPASLSLVADADAQQEFALSGMFLGGLVEGSPEPLLTGYLVTQAEYATWRQRKPFVAPTGSVEFRLAVHGDWTSRQSMTGTLRSVATCASTEGGVARVVLSGVLTRQ